MNQLSSHLPISHRALSLTPRKRLRSCNPSRFVWAAIARTDVDLKPGPKKNVLVLGGTGFVGLQVCRLLKQAGHDVTAVSRRGKPDPNQTDMQGLEGVKWVAADVVANPSVVKQIIEEMGGVDTLVHAIGMLLANDFNQYASGSGSIPTPGSTYDQVTRQTALAAASAFQEATQSRLDPAAFVFISAAEAGWTQDPPLCPPFLSEYLVAKRAVESELLDKYGVSKTLRPVIMRPSLIYTPRKWASLPAVAAFQVGNSIGLPGVDRPVLLDTLAKAVVKGIQDPTVMGIHNYKGMEKLAGLQ